MWIGYPIEVYFSIIEDFSQIEIWSQNSHFEKQA